MAQISWTEEALRWLNDIFEYIAADNPEAAARTVEGIYDRAQDLSRFPELGSRYSASTRHVRNCFMATTGLLISSKMTEILSILGVFHGALDIAKYQL